MAMSTQCNPFESDDIVKGWEPQSRDEDVHMGLDIWRSLTAEQHERIVRTEALENGIERPQGYTVSFHHNPRLEAHHFGKNHPMKPWRLTLTKQLVLSYGLQYAMDLYQSRPADAEELKRFHRSDYIDFLQAIDPERQGSNHKPPDENTRAKYLGSIDVGADCPIFDGMWSYFTYYSGASLEATSALMTDRSNIAINWSGGLHHAHKHIAAGFCFVNDIVLAILQLLLIHPRVLYIDIDVHHGDGVEEAFHSTDRVLTLSYHKFAEGFFPGTGARESTGPTDPKNPGAHHTLNVPIKEGIYDHEYTSLFERITGKVIEVYNPTAIVLQCGADSLGGDKLGNFNVNIKAHGFCVDFVKTKCHNRALLIIGGGGYTPRNVARCWTHETSLCVGATLHDNLPAHVPYRQAFMGDEKGNGRLYPQLDIASKLHENKNTKEDLEDVVENIYEQLRYIQGSPSVQMQQIPNNYAQIWADDQDSSEDRDEDENGHASESMRRKKERNIGGRSELIDDGYFSRAI